MTILWQNLRYALRQLRRSPGFAITAVLTLALGVGANTAIFSLLDQALLRSLPVRDPGQLVILQGTGKAWNGRSSTHGGDVETYFSYPMYRDLRDKAKSFDGLIATTPENLALQRRGEPEAVDGEMVSGNYFHVLGLTPAAGRLFTESDDSISGNHQVAVMSYDYWRNSMGADSRVIGETVRLNAQPVTVIGVAPANFQSAVWGQTPAVFVPMAMQAQLDTRQVDRSNIHADRWLNIIGRLHDGLTPETAQAQLAPLWHALRADELAAMGKRSPRFTQSFLNASQLKLQPGARGLSYRREGLQKPLLVVMGMAALVLLIAAVNVASLLLVRASARVREFSLRYALGATAQRVFSQVLLEGLIIGLLGAIVGVAMAPLATHTLAHRMVDDGDTTFFQAGVDTRLLFFSFAVAVLVSMLFSAAPALRLMRPDLVSSLKEQAGTGGSGRLGFRRVVVGLQIGLSVLLLVGAGLFVRTLQNLRTQNVGFNTTHLLTFTIEPQQAGVPRERIPALYQQVLDRLAVLPGVTAVGATTSPELAGSDSGSNVTVEGYTPPTDEDLDISVASVSPGYFDTLKMPIVAGRAFSDTDDLEHPLVAVVNQSFARHYFGSDAAAIGRRMARGGGNKLQWMQIVGVSRDAKHSDLRQPAKMTNLTPLRQNKEAFYIALYLRTANAPMQDANSVRATVRSIDQGLAAEGLKTMEGQIEQTLSNDRLIELLAISFGVLAAILAGVGLYGVLAYSTAQRTREIGIRMALGSSRERISGIVLMDVLRLAGVGLLVAVPCALLLARTLRSQLYGVSPADPVTVICVVGLISIIALIAALIPARRAASVDPNVALRTE